MDSVEIVWDVVLANVFESNKVEFLSNKNFAFIQYL